MAIKYKNKKKGNVRKVTISDIDVDGWKVTAKRRTIKLEGVDFDFDALIESNIGGHLPEPKRESKALPWIKSVVDKFKK